MKKTVKAWGIVPPPNMGGLWLATIFHLRSRAIQEAQCHFPGKSWAAFKAEGWSVQRLEIPYDDGKKGRGQGK